MKQLLLDLIEAETLAKEHGDKASDLRKRLKLELQEAELDSFKTDEGPSCSLSAPQVYASYDEGDEPEVFAWMEKGGLDGLIKRTVHKKTLSATIKDLMEQGVEVPELIKVHTDRTLYVRRNGYGA